MKAFFAFFRLVRIQNLLIIALTQYLMRICILKGNLDVKVLDLLMSEFDFFLLVISTVFIAAAGYIINDYFDLKIDRINKPKTIIVGRLIKRRVAMVAHLIINFIGLGIAAYLAHKMGKWSFMSIHLLAAISLWYYSTNFKNQFLVGNLIIAFLAGIVPLVVGLYEVLLQNQTHLEILAKYPIWFNSLAFYIIGYSVFAFLLTLVREITKDIIDIKGDKAYGCKTIPITIGIAKSKWIIILLYFFIAFLILWVQFDLLKDMPKMMYFTISLALLMLVNSFMIYTAKTRAQFKRSSNLNKIASVIGVTSSVLWFFLITNYSFFQYLKDVISNQLG